MPNSEKQRDSSPDHRTKLFHTLESLLTGWVLCLIPIHLIGSFISAINSIDKGYGHSYPATTYVLIGFWLVIVIAVDVFILSFKRFVFSKALQHYWGISLAILVIMLVCVQTLDTYQFGLLIVLGFLVTPYGILFPLLELFFIETTSLNIAIVIVFCLLNWALCKCFQL